MIKQTNEEIITEVINDIDKSIENIDAEKNSLHDMIIVDRKELKTLLEGYKEMFLQLMAIRREKGEL